MVSMFTMILTYHAHNREEEEERREEGGREGDRWECGEEKVR